ncbi:hypothetical protein BKA80DRAFT_18647 [Phyllosticta citrichinensis]
MNPFVEQHRREWAQRVSDAIEHVRECAFVWSTTATLWLFIVGILWSLLQDTSENRRDFCRTHIQSLNRQAVASWMMLVGNMLGRTNCQRRCKWALYATCILLLAIRSSAIIYAQSIDGEVPTVIESFRAFKAVMGSIWRKRC